MRLFKNDILYFVKFLNVFSIVLFFFSKIEWMLMYDIGDIFSFKLKYFFLVLFLVFGSIRGKRKVSL